MANIAVINAGIVILIVPNINRIPDGTIYDETQDGTGASIGDTWDGQLYIPKEHPLEVNNKIILESAIEQILLDIRPIANGEGNMSVAELTPVIRTLCTGMIILIRLSLNKFEDIN